LHVVMGMFGVVVVKPLGAPLCTRPGVNSSCDTLAQSITVATATGDPTIVGLRGQTFQVHGIDGAVYNLISSRTVQLNAVFNYRENGQCPPHRDILCWSHHGSYIGAVGLMVRSLDNTLVAIEVVSGPAKKGFSIITVQNNTLSISSKQRLYADGLVKITYPDSHHVAIETPLFRFEFDSSDQFLNQRITPLIDLSELMSMHGIIGQTRSTRLYPHNPIKYIEGAVDDYLVEEQNVFGKTFLFNKW